MAKTPKLFNKEQIELISDIVKNYITGSAPSHLIDKIKVKVTSRIDGWSTRFWVEPVGEGRRSGQDARAQELGSGEHATIGEKKRYRIKPKTPGGVLSFTWEKANKDGLLKHLHWRAKAAKEEGRVSDWRKKKPYKVHSVVGMFSAQSSSHAWYYGSKGGLMVRMNYVDHPGIKPYKGRGYLKYGIEKARNSLDGWLKFQGVKAVEKIIYENLTFRKLKK